MGTKGTKPRGMVPDDSRLRGNDRAQSKPKAKRQPKLKRTQSIARKTRERKR